MVVTTEIVLALQKPAAPELLIAVMSKTVVTTAVTVTLLLTANVSALRPAGRAVEMITALPAAAASVKEEWTQITQWMISLNLQTSLGKTRYVLTAQ